MGLEYLTGLGLGLFGIVLVVLLGLLLYVSAKRGLKLLLRHQYLDHSAYVYAKVSVRWLCLLVVLVLVLQQVGVQLTHILAGLLTVAGMVAIGFIAVWSVLSNVMCALLLSATGSFRIGDEIEVLEPAIQERGVRGRVVGFNLMYTTLVEVASLPPADNAADSSPAGQNQGAVAIAGAAAESGLLIQVPNNIFFQKALRLRPGVNSTSLNHHLLSKPLPFQRGKKT